MATLTQNWSAQGAIRTAIRRMKDKDGKSPAAIANILQLAHTHPEKAKGRIGGAIKRMKKHLLTDGQIIAELVNGFMAYTNKHVEPIDATPVAVTPPAPVAVTPPAPVAVKAAKVDNRTPEEKAHAKGRMAYLRSCRKGNVKLAYVEPISNKRESDLPVATVPTASKLKAPIVLNSFDELETLLNDLGIA